MGVFATGWATVRNFDDMRRVGRRDCPHAQVDDVLADERYLRFGGIENCGEGGRCAQARRGVVNHAVLR